MDPLLSACIASLFVVAIVGGLRAIVTERKKYAAEEGGRHPAAKLGPRWTDRD
jgi:hypothetical protein